MAGVRRFSKGDLRSLTRLMSLGFGAGEAEARRYYTENPRLDPAQVHVLEEDGEVRATATVLPLEAFVDGVARPVDGVAAVNTHPAHRRKGYAGELMRAILRDMRERGVHLSMLWPFAHPFYRHFGYELAGESVGYELSPRGLATSPQQRYVRELRDGDLGPVMALHEEQGHRHRMYLRRSERHWQNLSWRGELEAVVYEVGGEIEGCILYRMSDWRQEKEPHRRLDVRELVWRTPGALEGLLSFLAAQDPLVFGIKLATPRGEPLHPYLGSSHVEARVRPEFMLRLVDVEGALGFLRHDIPEPLVLEVSDNGILENVREYRVGGGKARERVRLDVRQLAQLYAGYLSTSQLARHGLIDSSSPRALELLGELFPPGDPWVSPPDHF